MNPTRVILHCSDSPNGRPVDISEIRQWHLARGFTDVGYHFTINVDGTTQVGRPTSEIGAHCEGENHDSIGVCMVGKDKFSKAQFDALYLLCIQLKDSLNIPATRWFGHYEFPSAKAQGKTCPNMRITDIVLWLVMYQQPQFLTPYLMEEIT